MQATLDFDPSQFSDRANRLILAKASEWGCTPAQAVARLLDRIATRSPKPAAPSPAPETDEQRPAA